MNGMFQKHARCFLYKHYGRFSDAKKSKQAKRAASILIILTMTLSLALTNVITDLPGRVGAIRALAAFESGVEQPQINDESDPENTPEAAAEAAPEAAPEEAGTGAPIGIGIMPLALQLPIDLSAAAIDGTGYTISGTDPDKILTFDSSANDHTYTITQTGASQFSSIIFNSGVAIGDGSAEGVTLDGITFTGNIELKGDADITLLLVKDKINTINGCIIVPETSSTVLASLTINSAEGDESTEGFLEVENDARYNAAIGGGNNQSAGNITIKGGTVYATNLADDATAYGAGIGGGAGGSGGTITISGGEVNVTGYTGTHYGTGAGIGGGGADTMKNAGDGGQITLTGGTVTAVGYDGPNQGYGAGIGGGGGGGSDGGGALRSAGDGGTITIDGCTVTAIGGKGSGISAGAGIGGGGSLLAGYPGDGGIITISDGEVNASGYSGSDKGYGAGIGGGGAYHDMILSITDAGSGGDIAISGGIVNAYDSDGSGICYGAAIGGGGGYWNTGAGGSGGDITISGDAEVTAISYGAGAAVGGGGKDGSSGDGGEGGNITIGDAANVTAISPNGQSSGIGGGSGYADGDGGIGGTIIIKDTSVVFAGGGANGGAGIGGGGKGAGTSEDGVGADITIDPTADVTAYSSGTLPAIHAANDNIIDSGHGGGYFINAIFETGVLPAAATTLEVLPSGDTTILAVLTLPAAYRGFAFTLPAGVAPAAYDSTASHAYNIDAYDLSSELLGAVIRASDDSDQIYSIIGLADYDTDNTMNAGEGWLPVKIGASAPGVKKTTAFPSNFRKMAQNGSVVEAGKPVAYDISFGMPFDISELDNVRIEDMMPGGLCFVSAWLIIGNGGIAPINVTGSITGLNAFGMGTLSYVLEGANLSASAGEKVTLNIVAQIITAPSAGIITNKAKLYYTIEGIETQGGEAESTIISEEKQE